MLEHDTHGKHLLTRFDNGQTLHTHLRMDGSWTVVRPGKALPRALDPDIRVLLAAEGGPTAYGLLIPIVELVATAAEDQVVGYLGPDPLREDWDARRPSPGWRPSRTGRSTQRCWTSEIWPGSATCG